MGRTWYEALDFECNPLDIRPNPNLVGLEEEEGKLVNFIQKGELCFLNGLTGSGKTSMLQKIYNKLRNDYTFLYLNAEDLPKNFELLAAIKGKRGIFDFVRFRQFPRKPVVLLIDEFQATDSNLVVEAKGKWESQNQKVVHSIVVAQISPYLKNASGSFRDRLGRRIIKLKSLDDETMKDILKQRLLNNKARVNYYDKFSKDAVDLIVKCADGSVRRLLEYSDLVFDFHHTRFGNNNPIIKGKDYKILYHGAKEILALSSISIRPYETEIKKEDGAAFDKEFTKVDKKVMRYLMSHEAKSSIRLAKGLRMKISTVSRTITGLKKRDMVVEVGKKGKHALWDLSQHAKRIMVKY